MAYTPIKDLHLVPEEDIKAVTPKQIPIATDALNILLDKHIETFGTTNINKNMKLALQVMKIAEYTKSASTDPEAAISELSRVGAHILLDKLPIIKQLNLLGYAACIVLPDLRRTAEGLRTHNPELHDEFIESKAIVEILAAYYVGAEWIVNNTIDFTMSNIKNLPGFLEAAVKKGNEIAEITEKLDPGLIKELPEFAQEIETTASKIVAKPKIHTEVIRPEASMPLTFGARIYGGTGKGIVAAGTITTGITLTSLMSAGLIGVALTISGIFIRNHDRAKRRDFGRANKKVKAKIDELIQKINEICNSEVASEKITKLHEIAYQIRDLPKDMGPFVNEICKTLDTPLGGKAARPVVDQYRKIIGSIYLELSEKIIPELSKAVSILEAVDTNINIGGANER